MECNELAEHAIEKGMTIGRTYLTEMLASSSHYQKGINPDLRPFEQWAITNQVIVKPTDKNMGVTAMPKS